MECECLLLHHTDMDTCHLVLLNHITLTRSHAQWEIQCPQELPRSPLGSGWYRLADAWKSTAQRSVGPGVPAEAGPNSWWPLSSEDPLYTPLGPSRDSGLHHAGDPPIALPASLLSQVAWGLSPGFTLCLDLFQPVPVGRHSIVLLSDSLETQWGTLFLDLGRRKRREKMVTVSLNICPASLLIIIKLMLIYYFGLVIATTYYSIY